MTFTKSELQLICKLINNKIVQLQSERASTLKYGNINHPKDREEIEKIDRDIQTAEICYKKLRRHLPYDNQC